MESRTQTENKTIPSEDKHSVKKLNKGMDLTPEGQLIITSYLGDKTAILHSNINHHIDEKEIKTLTAEITKETESYLTGWTSSGQKNYLKDSIVKLISENKIKDKNLVEAFQQEKTQALLLDMLYNAKYIFLTKDLKEKEIYFEAFKVSLKTLEKEIGIEKIKSYFTACIQERNLCRLLPLAAWFIDTHSSHLEDFNLSETLAHRIAYAIAKNQGQIKKVIINDKEGRLLSSYQVEEMHVMKNDGQKDRGLIGAILMPEQVDATAIPTLRILWAGTHSKETIKIDSEICPGEESYRRGEDQVLKCVIEKINEIYKRSEKPINIVISGHSLGGALAQLTFHSLQRILVQNSEENETQTKGKQWEIEFQKKLTQETDGVEHQRPLAEIKIQPDFIHGMSLEAWNSPGVLRSVAKHSNQMCAALVDEGILQEAIYGLVHGDVVQTGGQDMVLSDIGKNKAKARLLKIIPNSLNLTTKSMASMGAFSIGRVLGAAALGGPVGSVTAAVTLGGMTYASLGKLAADAHRMHHFRESKTPQHPYILLTSHFPDGSINQTECAAICTELSCKSRVVDVGARAISSLSVTQARMETIKEKKEAKFKVDLQQAEEKKSSDSFMGLIISEMKNQPATAATRVLKIIDDEKLSINAINSEGKSILHLAIEYGCSDLAMRLLEKDKIDINLQDYFGNTPLLTFMLNSSASYDVGLKILLHPKIDITKKNERGISARALHDGWRSYGAPGSQAREFCLKLKEMLMRIPHVPEVVKRIRVSI